MFSHYILNPFLEVLKKYPGKNAFCIAEKFYTYSDFALHVSKIREALRSEKITSKNVGLVANDDIETYAAIFALWFEGLAYVPLHPMQPADRNIEIISQAGIELVICSVPDMSFQGVRFIYSSRLETGKLMLEPSLAADEDLAYILFTSGSTGKPKGVPIMRKNVGAFMKSFAKAGFSITCEDKCLQCFDLTFDVSVQSYLVPLTTGACTYTIPHDQIKYSYVYGLLEDHQLTFGAMAPSMIRYLRPYFDEINAPGMRYNILTAEASPADLVAEWSKCIPNAEIYDFYGPTEATIYCTYYKCGSDGNYKNLNGNLSIGKPMDGITAIIRDENGNVTERGKKGELCISGDQLTPGYWNNQEKTAESFFDLIWEGELRRFYKTGDSCFFDDEGDILYAGRLDYQVKIQGYRIELSEIEYHAREWLKGQNAVAVAYENTTGNSEIALFVEDDQAAIDPLQAYLKSKMPPYMVPSKVYLKSKFPLNANGKIDRNVLKKSIIL